MPPVANEEQDALGRDAIGNEPSGTLDQSCCLTAGAGSEDLQRAVLEIDDRLLNLVQGSFFYLLAQLLSPR